MTSQPTTGEAPRTTNRWWRALQVALLVATVAFVARALARQWSDVRELALQTRIHWGWLAISSVIVLAVHASLVQSWRMVLRGWGSSLPFGAAVRIWTISGLGKYVPGKLWSIGAMSVLTQREGGSSVTAAGAALLGTMLNLGAGFGVVAIAGAPVLRTFDSPLRNLALAGAAVFVSGVAVLPWLLPPVVTRLAVWRGLPTPRAHLSAGIVWLATGTNILAWIGYGVAFILFAKAIAPEVAGPPLTLVAAYAASYVMGYLAIWAPGGLGVREAILVQILVTLGIATLPVAWFLALASRVWLTLLEVVPGLVSLPLTPTAFGRLESQRAEQ